MNTALTYFPSMTEEKSEAYREVVELLLDAGADVNHVSRHGTTALLAACVLHNKEVVTLLLKKGANPKLGRRGNQSPLAYATHQGYAEIVKLLRQHGAED